MNYYLVTVQNDETQVVYKYTTKDEALVAYHNELAYRSEQRTSTLCVLLDVYGRTLYKERWERESDEIDS